MTHRFHPWFDREFVFVAIRQTWGEDRVFFLDEEGLQQSLPVGWTDAAEPDVFVAVAAGRSAFRVEDLVALAVLVAQARDGHCKVNSVRDVRAFLPDQITNLPATGR